MKTSKKLIRCTCKTLTRWTMWVVLSLLISPGNELKAIHTLPDNTPLRAMISPCDAMGSGDYYESISTFKQLPIKEKRQVMKKNRHVMKAYKSQCPEQYKLIKKQSSVIFWTDVWHVGVAIVLLPVALVVGILALAVYLFLESLDNEE